MITSKEWDIEYLKNQILMCENSITNGNWNEYSENLAVRKQRLKELKEQLKNIEKCCT